MGAQPIPAARLPLRTCAVLLHRSAELTTLLSKDLDAVRSFVFANVTRDRGLRAVLEAVGSVGVLFWLSWRLGPILAGERVGQRAHEVPAGPRQ